MHFIPSVCITKHPNGIKSKIHIVEYVLRPNLVHNLVVNAK